MPSLSETVWSRHEEYWRHIYDYIRIYVRICLTSFYCVSVRQCYQPSRINFTCNYTPHCSTYILWKRVKNMWEESMQLARKRYGCFGSQYIRNFKYIIYNSPAVDPHSTESPACVRHNSIIHRPPRVEVGESWTQPSFPQNQYKNTLCTEASEPYLLILLWEKEAMKVQGSNHYPSCFSQFQQLQFQEVTFAQATCLRPFIIFYLNIFWHFANDVASFLKRRLFKGATSKRNSEGKQTSFAITAFPQRMNPQSAKVY